ncbi:MAG: hypothetical protein KatS3mg089_0866 [Patescibacteria group bacterium]|nr:MAG: hypothetical protein KatS3mg089_0866 [Patescibacteria group bacterium]
MEHKIHDPLTAILLDPEFHRAVEENRAAEFIAKRLGVTPEEASRMTDGRTKTNSPSPQSDEKANPAQKEAIQIASNSSELQNTPSFEDYWTRVRGGVGDVVPLNFARAHEEYPQNYQQSEKRAREKYQIGEQPHYYSQTSSKDTRILQAEGMQNQSLLRKNPSTSKDIIYYTPPQRRAGLLLTGGLLIGIVAGATGVIFTKDTLDPTKTSNLPSGQSPYTYSSSGPLEHGRNTTEENKKMLEAMSTMVINVAEEVDKRLNPSPTPTSTPNPIPTPTPDLAQQTSFCTTPEPGKLCRIPPPPPPTPTPYPSCEKMNELRPGDWCVWPTADPRGPYAASFE